MDYKEKYEQALEKARELMNKGYDVLIQKIYGGKELIVSLSDSMV